MDELRADIKEMKADIKTISATLEKNTASLIVHEARTTLNERRIEKFESLSHWITGMLLSGLCGLLVKLLVK